MNPSPQSTENTAEKEMGGVEEEEEEDTGETRTSKSCAKLM